MQLIIRFFLYPGVQLQFMDIAVANHGLVLVTAITSSQPLLCVTDRVDCCPPKNSSIAVGQWYFPNGNAVPSETGEDFYQTSGFSAVRLLRMSGNTSGIFRCDIPDAVGMLQTLYVGVYDSEGGK